MSAVDEILSYKKNPEEDFYGILNCDENSSVSRRRAFFQYSWASNWDISKTFHCKFTWKHELECLMSDFEKKLVFLDLSKV